MSSSSSSSGPRAGGPRRRRTFTPEQRLEHVAGYEQALTEGQGGAYLRRHGLHSSLLSEWRRLRDAGVLEGKNPGERIGRPSREQAEIARLRKELAETQRKLATTQTALDIMGKARALLEQISESGGHRAAARQALMGSYAQLRTAGVTTRAAAALTGVPRATATRHAATPAGDASTAAGAPEAGRARRCPANTLTAAERAQVLAVLNSAEFADQPPLQVYATLLERGVYLCSVATMYRILRANQLVVERRRLARHPARAIPELVATGPGQVYSWDITKLAGPDRGVYYDAYVMIDIYSRYIVGAHVHARESGPLAKEMMQQIFGIHGTPQVVHADRGTSMTSKTVATLLTDLGVTRSHSRPHVSNDNPYSEALFKTMKYLPVFPERFGSLTDARGFMDDFVHAYNHEHHHTGIGLHTPADVHYAHATTVAKARSSTLARARAAHPERFASQTDPKILALPADAWINKPPEEEQEDQQPAA
ncbi:IS3 family transposase [Flexivirga caeni]|uniref:IS3 family transposase n=1 Tax=Flexivirga caeni TaxID=2294115 RepID=UPI003CCC4D16